MKQNNVRGITGVFLALVAAITMIVAGLAGVALAGAANAAPGDPAGQGSCPAGYSYMFAENVSGQSIDWNPNADAAAVHSGGGVDADAFKTFYKPEPITAWNPNKPGTALLGLSNVVWCSKNAPETPKCDDGSVAPNGDKAQCPVKETPKCDDGSVAPNGDKAQCPVTPATPQTPGATSDGAAAQGTTPVASAPQAATTVSAPAAATTKAPAKVTVPQAATLPAGVPAGDGSEKTGMPMWAVLMVASGLVGAAMSAKGLLRSK